MTRPRPVVFDAYGTLFDVAAAARRASAEPGGEALAAAWPKLAADWRAKQLQYAWLRSIAGAHADFGVVTADALDWALEAAGLAGDPALRDRLLVLYRELDVFPEVPRMLAQLREAGHPLAILSNGSREMLDAAIAAAGLDGVFDAVLSVDAVGVFKPAAAVYDLVPQRFGVAPAETLFVSSNGWDAACAAGYGFTTAWANRDGQPVDRLPWRPAHVLRDLASVPGVARSPELRRFVTPDGVGLAWEEEGAGLPVLCLPGLTRNGADFDELAAALGGRVRLIRLTLRGRGASDRDPDPTRYSIPVETADVIAFLDHLGLDRVTVVGTSRGGLIAMVMAAMAKDRLAGVLLNDIGPELKPEGLAAILTYLGVAPRVTTLDDAATALERRMGAAFPGLPRATWLSLAGRWFDATPDGLVLNYDPRIRDNIEATAGQAAPDMWPLFDALAGVPLAVVRGGNSDLLSAETVAKMQARRPDLIVAEVPDRGHVPFLDEPEAMAALDALLARVATPA